MQSADRGWASAKRLVHREYAKLPAFTVAQYRDWNDIERIGEVANRVGQLVTSLAPDMPGVDTQELARQLLDELTSLGPLGQLMREEGVSEVMINGPRNIFIEKGGLLQRVDHVAFDSDEHVLAVAGQILAPQGKTVTRGSPMADTRMPDGSRVNVIVPPLATEGPTITIRRFSAKPYGGDDFVRFGSLSPNMLKFLELCVRERISMVIAGGTGSGKTTLLNVLSSFIPAHERIVTIEDAAELQLAQEHVVRLEARTSGLEVGEEEVSIRDLVINALRMRPDRIVVGECRGGEALDMLQAMNTGHEGSLTTLHANSPRDVLARLETLIMMAGVNLPLSAIRHQIASSIQVIVQVSRFRDGTRKVTAINEITGIQNDTMLMQEVFAFKTTGAADGAVQGRFTCRGFIPKLVQDLREIGIEIDMNMFAQAGVDKQF